MTYSFYPEFPLALSAVDPENSQANLLTIRNLIVTGQLDRLKGIELRMLAQKMIPIKLKLGVKLAEKMPKSILQDGTFKEIAFEYIRKHFHFKKAFMLQEKIQDPEIKKIESAFQALSLAFCSQIRTPSDIEGALKKISKITDPSIKRDTISLFVSGLIGYRHFKSALFVFNQLAEPNEKKQTLEKLVEEFTNIEQAPSRDSAEERAKYTIIQTELALLEFEKALDLANGWNLNPSIIVEAITHQFENLQLSNWNCFTRQLKSLIPKFCIENRNTICLSMIKNYPWQLIKGKRKKFTALVKGFNEEQRREAVVAINDKYCLFRFHRPFVKLDPLKATEMCNNPNLLHHSNCNTSFLPYYEIAQCYVANYVRHKEGDPFIKTLIRCTENPIVVLANQIDSYYQKHPTAPAIESIINLLSNHDFFNEYFLFLIAETILRHQGNLGLLKRFWDKLEVQKKHLTRKDFFEALDVMRLKEGFLQVYPECADSVGLPRERSFEEMQIEHIEIDEEIEFNAMMELI